MVLSVYGKTTLKCAFFHETVLTAWYSALCNTCLSYTHERPNPWNFCKQIENWQFWKTQFFWVSHFGFFFQKSGNLLPKLFWPTVRTIHSNSEGSEQFLVTECYFILFMEVSQYDKLEQLEFKLEIFWGFRNMQ